MRRLGSLSPGQDGVFCWELRSFGLKLLGS